MLMAIGYARGCTEFTNVSRLFYVLRREFNNLPFQNAPINVCTMYVCSAPPVNEFTQRKQ